MKLRLESLQLLRKISFNFENIEGKNDSMISFFENLLISDIDEKIRNEAALILCYDYKEKAMNPMRWALFHEESPLCLQTIFNSLVTIVKNLEETNNAITKLIMVHEIKQIDD